MSPLFARILVPFDFSAQARRALETAISLAAENEGELTVLCAIAPVTSLAGIRPPGGPVWMPPDDWVDAERRRLESIVRDVLAGRTLRAVHCRIAIGEPPDEILAAARRATLIVMATTGRSRFARLVIGSVAEKIVRHAPVPVLTLGPTATARLARSSTEVSARVRARPGRRRTSLAQRRVRGSARA